MLVEFNVHCVKTHGSLNKTGTTFINAGIAKDWCQDGKEGFFGGARNDDDDDDDEE